MRMNNPDMYNRELAGGTPYPETEKYSYSSWYCATGLSDTTEYKTVRFSLRQDNLLLHWTNGYLEMQGQLVQKANKAVMPEQALITFAHNGLIHLFDNIKFTIGNQMVENINIPGHVSSLMFDVLLARSKSKNDGLSFLWSPDTTTTASIEDNKGFAVRQGWIIDKATTRGTFKARLPLYMLFGFVENYLALSAYPAGL